MNLEVLCVSDMLWKAPELLRSRNVNIHGTQKGDVYSFAIILYEIHGRKGPWGDIEYPAKGEKTNDKDGEKDTCILKGRIRYTYRGPKTTSTPSREKKKLFFPFDGVVLQSTIFQMHVLVVHI